MWLGRIILVGAPRTSFGREEPTMLRTLTMFFHSLAPSTMLLAILGSVVEAQEDIGAGYLGRWEYDGPHVHFTFLLTPDGTGYLADGVDTFPFTYSLDASSDPARLDLIYEVDMAFGRISHSLVRLEKTDRGDLLHWVSRHSDSGPPEWPEASSRTPSGVTWITFHRERS
jgi:hypothetical protein